MSVDIKSEIFSMQIYSGYSSKGRCTPGAELYTGYSF